MNFNPEFMEKTFELGEEEFIELNKLLKIMNLAGSGGEANFLVSSGEVKVNDEIESRKRKKIRAGDKVEVGSVTVFIVSS